MGTEDSGALLMPLGSGLRSGFFCEGRAGISVFINAGGQSSGVTSGSSLMAILHVLS